MTLHQPTYQAQRSARRIVHASLACICALLLALAGCSSVKIRNLPSRATADDWTQYGGSQERRNHTAAALTPPLAVAWDYATDAGFAPFSAVAQGEHIIAADLHGDVHIIDIASGKGGSIHGFGSAIYGTPVVQGTVLVVALANDDDDNLQAYDMESGDILWKARVPDIETSPLLIDSMLYATTVSGDLVCVNKNTGVTRWTFADPDPNARSQSHSSPAGTDSIIVYGRDNGTLVAVNRASGTLRWKTRIARGVVAAPVIAGDTVYAGATDSTLAAFDLRTGRIYWTQRMPGRIFTAVTAGAEHLYAGTASGLLLCLRRSDGAAVWRYQAKNGFGAAPLLAGSTLYAGSLDRTLTAFDAASGAVQWQWTGEGRIKSTPIIHRNALIVLEDSKAVIAFRAPATAEGRTP